MKIKQLFALFVFALAAWTLSAQSPAGLWKTIDDETGKPKSHLEIKDNDGKFSANIVKLLQSESSKVCEKCSGAKKNQPLIGMEIMWGLYKKDGYWQGGRILDPNKGSEYGCSFWFENGNPDILNVKGIHWTGLSRTQKWYRIQ
jgi:uncharacterized protein (DUF2147 family)